MSEITHTIEAHRTTGGVPLVSVVVPAYNEQEVLPEFVRRTRAVMETLGVRYEIVFVNDGSTDASRSIMLDLRAGDPRICVVDLSRNFGKEIALTAGIDHARGDAVVVIDADLQDPPELIPEMILEWQAGFDVVYAQRVARDGETWMKKATARCFYRLMQRIGPVHIPPDTGDFRLMSRKSVDALSQLRERHRFMKGLFAWVGFRSKAILYTRDPRFAGTTKWNYWKLWNLSLEGITSFTVAPLKIAMYFGFATAAFAFLFGAWTVLKTLVLGDPVPGFPALMTTVLFLGGAQLMAIGVVGEYLGRIFNETKRRPLYLTQNVHQAMLDTDDFGRKSRDLAALPPALVTHAS